MDIAISNNINRYIEKMNGESICIALIAAAGKGTRMGAEIPKQLMSYKGMTVIERTASVFAAHEEIDAIFLSITSLVISALAASCIKITTSPAPDAQSLLASPFSSR